MSEAITKACGRCAGTGREPFSILPTDCPDCKGTGRVPDEVATLRAQIDAARAEVARLRDAATEDIAALAAENEHLAAEVARLTAQEREAARILSFVSTAHASAWAAEAEAWLARCAPEVTHG